MSGAGHSVAGRVLLAALAATACAAPPAGAATSPSPATLPAVSPGASRVESAAAAPAAQPRSLALLVGVARYPKLPAGAQLKGPENDVQLLKALLTERGFAVTVLSTADVHALPTRAAIIMAMRDLAARARRGDFVLVFFSGHGSQQPDAGLPGYAAKPDGLEETFLPSDVGHWDERVGTVSGALLDHEIGSLLHGIRNTGAFVWAVFDSCHSATLTRAPRNAAERDRRVRPGELGVPAESRQSPPATASGIVAGARPGALVPPTPLRADAGGSVAFYAAQTTETTPEMPLPDTSPSSPVHGLFSYALAAAIVAAPAASYRQLGQQVLQTYAAMNREAPTPLFEGNLDQAVFRYDAQAPTARQWRLRATSDGLRLAAGRLHRIGPGARLRVLPSPAAPDDKAIGVVEVDEVRETISSVHWVQNAAHPTLPPGAYARLIDAGNLDVTFEVWLARPLACRDDPRGGGLLCPADATDADRSFLSVATQLLDDNASGKPAHLRFGAEPSADAQIRPLVYRGRLWLLPPGGDLVLQGDRRTYSIPLEGNADQLRQTLFAALASAARAINLARVGAALGTESIPLEVQLSVAGRSPAGGPASRQIVRDAIPELHHGDQLSFELANRGAEPIDVTMLDIGARFGIAKVFPLPGETNRLAAGAHLSIPGAIDPKADEMGRETMLIIATAARPGEEAEDFSDLVQPPLAVDRSARRPSRHPAGGVGELLREAALGDVRGTRTLRANESPTTLLRYSWVVRSATP